MSLSTSDPDSDTSPETNSRMKDVKDGRHRNDGYLSPRSPEQSPDSADLSDIPDLVCGLSADDPRHLYHEYHSDSEHSDADHHHRVTGPLLRRGTRARRQLQNRVETLVRDLREKQQVFNRRRQDLAQNVNRKIRNQLLTRQEELVRRSKLMATKLQSGHSRAWRHKIIFALVQTDFAATAFWLGASPETFYFYYTGQALFVLGCKVLDYRVNEQHYYLLDFCYFANLCILCWLWLFPTSAMWFNAVDGFCGLLAISIVVFRNSCVPHDFVRISHAYVHYPAVLVMLSVKMRCKGDICIGLQEGQALPWTQRLCQAWSLYMTWAVIYASIIFVIASKRIDRKNRDTLYNYFANTLGYKEKLPKALRSYAKVFFMLGHQVLFLSGIWWILLPTAFQVIFACLALLVFFHNGGRFYVDHFWKSYERNMLLYVDAATSAMAEVDRQGERHATQDEDRPCERAG